MSEPERADRASTANAARWLLRLGLGRDRGRAVLAFLPIAPLCIGATAVALRAVIDGFGTHDTAAALGAASLGGASLFVLFAGSYWQASTSLLRLREQAEIAVDEEILHLTADVPTLEHFDDARYLDRIEILRIAKFPLTQVVALLRDTTFLAMSLLVTTVLLASVDVRLAALPLFMIPVLITYYRSQEHLNAAERDVAERRRDALHLFDVGTGFAEGKELRVLRQERALQSMYARVWQSVVDDLTRAETRTMAARAAAWMLYAAAVVVGLLIVIEDPPGGSVTAGALFLAVTVSVQLGTQATYAAQVMGTIAATLELARHVIWLQDRSTELGGPVDGSAAATPAPARLRDGINLHGVTFQYPGSTTAALHDVDLEFEAGTTVAIVGENGAGKSTLVKLLCRLYLPTAGTITVDDTDLTTIDPAAWFQGAAIVCQDYAQFEFVLRQSIGVGDLAAIENDDVIQAAAARGDATTIIDSLGRGLDAQLGSRFGGTDLSGGQWQRLALARGMMRATPILLALDEPTGALDAHAEQALLQRLITQARALATTTGAVVVFVSHRYSTVRAADQIVALDHAQVIEHGTHAELMERAGLYADLYSRQAAAYQ